MREFLCGMKSRLVVKLCMRLHLSKMYDYIYIHVGTIMDYMEQ